MATGIIAEFNPFHNGHKYVIDAARNLNGSRAVVCVMSGDFVQRGAPASADKWARARAAVMGGADLVVELPAVYALSSAEDFAFGGVRVLKALGVDSVVFGSESGDVQALKEAVRIMGSVAGVKEGLSLGLSYPAAYAKAAENAGLSLDFEPNDILGCEYIRAAEKLDFSPEFYAVKRAGGDHNSLLPSDGYASASWLREAIKGGIDKEKLLKYIPAEAEGLISECCFNAEAGKRLFDLIKYKIVSSSSEELAEYFSVSEGLENRIKEAVLKSDSVSNLILNIKSKRYTYARISRILMQILLGITKDMKIAVDEAPAYIRVLSFNQKGAEHLRELKKSENPPLIITNVNKEFGNVGEFGPGLELDILAADIYSVICGRELYRNSDYVNIPKMIL